MKITVHPGDRNLPFLPTPRQELLLKACLFEGSEALTAWHAWRASTDLDQIDAGSLRLLPLLANKLQSLGVKELAVEKYRGIQRLTWARNQLLLRAAAAVSKQFTIAKIPVMALKGIVLATTYYNTTSLRAMDDFDLLVRRTDGPNALKLLEELGWLAVAGQFRPATPVELAVRPACAFQDPGNREVQVDLHWRLFWGRFSDEADAALWVRAVRFEIEGTVCLAPCAADMLVHVCAHGVGWSDPPSVRWVADAAFLIRSGKIDWKHVCAQTDRLGLTPALLATLNYLRKEMHVQVPDDIVRHLTTLHVKSIDRLLYKLELEPPYRMSFLTALKIHKHIAWQELARSQGLRGYVRYFAAVRRGRNAFQLALWVYRRLMRR